MKKTKITGKNSKKKTSKPSASKQQKQVKAKNNSAAETLSRQAGMTKKDSPKKTDNGVSVLKRYFSIVRQFLADSKMELKKVTWPTKKELFSVTAVVIVLVFFIAFFLGLVDFGLVKIIKNIVG